MSNSTIASIEAWTVRFPLRRPVVLESMVFSDRDYAIVRLTDRDGVQGHSYCLARNAPLTAAVAAVAPVIKGSDPAFSERSWARMYDSTITHGQRGITLRAISLIDIALWDLRAKRAGQPLYQLLGALRSEVPVSVGGGYFRDSRSREEIADELAAYANAGFEHVKVPAGGLTPKAEEEWVAQVREAVGAEVELAIDAHWSWRTVEQAAAVLRRLDGLNLAWVEDPLPPEALASVAALRRRIATPVAVGDEQSGRWAYQNMIELNAVDIWRVDATCVGGISEFQKVAALAATWGIEISTHIYPELHIHCALADEAVQRIEYTDPEADIDLSFRFISPVISPSRGRAQAPTGPGLGIDLDWEQIETTATDRIAIR
jgi:L-alanine-DL-glutamate epimerase-like enolase superfamily enzyme